MLFENWGTILKRQKYILWSIVNEYREGKVRKTIEIRMFNKQLKSKKINLLFKEQQRTFCIMGQQV